MNTAQAKKTDSHTQAKSLEIRQLVTALALSQADSTTLDYLSFLAGIVPVRAAFFLHVQPRFDLLNDLFEREAQSVVSNFDFHADLVRQLEQEVHNHFPANSDTQMQADVREGDTLEEILLLSDDLKADLVVAGKSTTGDAHGILAGNLVRKTKCNTLVVPDKSKTKLERILVPVDFSPYSVRALQTTAALAQQYPGTYEVILLHLYDLPNIMAFMINKTENDLKAIIEMDRQAALEDFLRNFAPELAERSRLIVQRHEEGSIAEQVIHLAKTNEADLIVLGAKGHSKVELLLMGSVTESLLRLNDSIPVWVIK